jgi:hypothetical protein
MARHKMVDGVRIPLTAEEEAARDAEEAAWSAGAFDRAIANLRNDRNRKLAASDWSVLSDVALTVEKDTEWKDYRKALRDLPAGLTTEDQVKAVTWPTEPSP